MDISPNAHKTHDTTYRPYGAEEEGRPRYTYFSLSLSVAQDDCRRERERGTWEGERKGRK